MLESFIQSQKHQAAKWGFRCRASRQIFSNISCIANVANVHPTLKFPIKPQQVQGLLPLIVLKNYNKVPEILRFSHYINSRTKQHLSIPESSLLHSPEVAEELRKKFRRYLAQGSLHEQFLGWSCEE